MDSKTSTLNPYAESYVPLANRETKNEDEGHKKTPGEGNISSSNKPVDDSKLKAQQFDDHLGSPSQKSDQMEDKIADEDSEMDLAYLQMIFPGICEQSLVDVYSVNRGDLEAAIDMLNHLESVDKLPDALDIEVAPKPNPNPNPNPGECSSVNGLNTANESSTSSGSSDLTVAT